MTASPDLPWKLAPPVALVGYGVEGRETLRYFRAHGVEPLTVFDRALNTEALDSQALNSQASRLAPEEEGVRFVGEGDWEAALQAFGTVVRSPGVRPDHPALLAAQAAGARVTSASALFMEACPGAVIGVTGTLGKGTTVSLIEAALRAEGIPCRVGGNIGTNPLAFLDALTPATVTALELSSFQLMGLEGPKPRVAVVLRTGEEHLDWHTDRAEYWAAKQGLLAGPGVGQQVIFCADSEGSRAVAAPGLKRAWGYSRIGPVKEGIGVEGGRVLRFRKGSALHLPALERLALPGNFNLENAAAAALAVEAVMALDAAPSLDVKGKSAALGDQGLAAIAEFGGLPHRLERVATVGGVTFYNDSYATRPDATMGAVSSFDVPLALILGGSEKHADFVPLAHLLVTHPSLQRVVLIGATAQRLAEAIKGAAIGTASEKGTAPDILRAETLPEAFVAALHALPEGGALLFSPACASFDMFANYKERGERFKALVAGMTGKI